MSVFVFLLAVAFFWVLSGRVFPYFKCSRCKGSGWVGLKRIGRPCPVCSGKGYRERMASRAWKAIRRG
jgi:DnaJ-class molecular chaperone